MSPDEIRLLLILPALFLLYAFFGVMSMRRSIMLFILACVAGFLAQLPLGRELNLYTPNITLYISFVSVAAMLTWGIALTSIYLAQLWVARVLGAAPGLALYVSVGVLILTFVEFLGSNFIHMKLHNFTIYSPLMPQLNAMHAPAWLYGYYVIMAVVFYFVVRELHSKADKRCRTLSLSRTPSMPAPAIPPQNLS